MTIITIIVIALILLWLTGFFGPPVIPAIALPAIDIAWSNPYIQALVIIAVIVIVVSLIRR
jgi:uncharacterized membrane protein